ncbi:MAG: hypothetical protein LBK25_04515 [Treponema sp.]|nr:hypothetical protein [Treponema sp.]
MHASGTYAVFAPFGCQTTSQRVLYERVRRCPRQDGTTLVNKRGSCSVSDTLLFR